MPCVKPCYLERVKIALVNLSSDPMISPSLLAKIAEALEHQGASHYEEVWQSRGAPVLVYPSLEAVPNDGETSALTIYDDPDQFGALGWHDVMQNGVAFGRIFWRPVKEAGGTLLQGPLALSTVLSHEMLEMLGDPYINWWVDMPDGRTQDSLELGDRTQGDHYAIGDVSVSNFLGPRAFREGVGPYDYLGLLKSPFEIRPGGYAIRREMATGNVAFVWGEGVPEWKKALVVAHGRRVTAMKERHGQGSAEG